MLTTSLEKALGFGLNALNSSTHIYALCNYETLVEKSISLETFVQICLKYDVKIVQYRDKISSLDVQKKHLAYLKSQLSVPIIINDKLELIDLADGIHLGQEDLLELKNEKLKMKNDELVFKFLRKKYPNKLFGLSTHNELEILKANELDLDMIGLGAYRPTSTKDVDNILGDKITYLAKISSYPVCAIGGVKIDDCIENVSFNVIGSGLYED